jgi:hypothetical protein
MNNHFDLADVELIQDSVCLFYCDQCHFGYLSIVCVEQMNGSSHYFCISCLERHLDDDELLLLKSLATEAICSSPWITEITKPFLETFEKFVDGSEILKLLDSDTKHNLSIDEDAHNYLLERSAVINIKPAKKNPS